MINKTSEPLRTPMKLSAFFYFNRSRVPLFVFGLLFVAVSANAETKIYALTKLIEGHSTGGVPKERMTMIMTGGEMNGGFVLSGHDQSGALQRWSTTSAGQRDSIVVRAEISNDESKTWQRMGVSHL
jgi:hypothetical protein